MNKYTFKLDGKDLNINLGFGTTIEETGREDLIKGYEDSVVEKLINPISDYEITRYRHAPLDDNSSESPDIYYEFNFYDELGVTWSTTIPNTLGPNPYGYNFQGYTNEEISKNDKGLEKSFFKMDFYDSPHRTSNKFYMSNIMQPVKGESLYLSSIDLDCTNTAPFLNEWGYLNMNQPDNPIMDSTNTLTVFETRLNVKIPKFHFDMDDKNSGYFFYWLKNDDVVRTNRFFVTAKFFNGGDGDVVKFLNTLPSNIPIIDKNSFDPTVYLYYVVVLDKTNYTYRVTDMLGNRVGTTPANPVQYWEYINPT